MPEFDSSLHPHRRYNPLSDQWVLVSPQRSKRPWQGAQAKLSESIEPAYKADCYLCPGNSRTSGAENPEYTGCFVFDNDFAALTADTPASPGNSDDLLRSVSARGLSRVVCFSEDHSKTLPELPASAVRDVIDTFAAQISELGRDYVWVQAFENKGEMMGCSQPHPHGQVWATDFLPNELQRKDHNLKKHLESTGRNLLLDYAHRESSEKARTVIESDHWIAVVPYWAQWPFETMLLPKFEISRFDQLTEHQREDLAITFSELTIRYDNLFETTFPYSMGWHYAPFDRDSNGTLKESSHWQLHAIFYPPLLRNATIRKFMVGFEMLAESQRDLTAEQAADMLRFVSKTHYRTPS